MRNAFKPILFVILLFSIYACTEKEVPNPSNSDGKYYNLRYCELLIAFQQGNQIRADVYNTLFCNECPEQKWDAVDYDSITNEYNALLVVGNGPRYWVLDSIDGSENPIGDLCGDTIAEMSMTRVATVVADVNNLLSPFYDAITVERSTVFHFNKGRQVYQLKSSTDSCYIMQSFTTMADSTLTLEELPSLGQKLDLPIDWSFSTHKLESDFQLATSNGEATLVVDDLKNSYQYLAGGCIDN